jgi:hypothetical protein
VVDGYDGLRVFYTRGSVGVTINNVESEFFQTGKGLRLGGPTISLVIQFGSRYIIKNASKSCW